MATTNEPQQATPAQTAQNIQNELADRSQYIRTMAKDMAALTKGGAMPPSAQKPTPAPTPEPKNTQEPVAGVWLPKQEEPFFERPQAKEVPQETVALPSMQEASQIVAPTKPQIPTPPPAPAPTPAPQPTEDRAAILERLRQKVGESAQMSIQQAPAPATPKPAEPKEKEWPDIPTPPASFAEAPKVPPPAPAPAPVIPPPPPTPEWQNIPSPAPQFAPPQEPVPSRLPPLERAPRSDTYREPVEVVLPPQPNPTPAADPLHTYSSDFASRIDQKGASTFSVLAAEQDAGTRPTQEVFTPKKRGNGKALIAIGTGVLLLALAGGGIYATYQFVMTMRNTPIASLTVPSIVFADEYRELSGTGASLMQELVSVGEGTVVPGNVLVAYILSENTDQEGSLVTIPVGGAAFMRALQIPAPDILLRNIADESTVGVINVGGENAHFFALRVDSYERTYAGMLTWEPLMLRDLGPLFPLYLPAAAPEVEMEPVATTTSATTTPTTTPQAPRPIPQQGVALTRFSDTIIANRDVRVLRDSNGKALLVYGYSDKRTLIITRNEAAFTALLERLKSE